METPVSRRTLLGVGSAAAALSIAGCGASTENEPQGTHEATLVADIDEGEMQTAQQEAQAAQQDAQQRFEDGEIDREEAQQIVQDARDELEALQQDTSSPSPNSPQTVETRAALDAMLADHELVLVDCFAEWCGPCQQLKPIVKQMAADTAATVVTVDIDTLPDVAREWQVRSVPTLLLFVNGEPVERLMGVQPYDRLVEVITRYAEDE